MNEKKISRRTFVQAAGALAITPFSATTSGDGSSDRSPQTQSFTMPHEETTHSATWMAYGATTNAWGKTGPYGASRIIARHDLIRIAAELSRFEPVKMLVDNQRDLAEAKTFLGKVSTEPVFAGINALPPIERAGKIEFILAPLDDLWLRDTGPVFIRNGKNKLSAVNFNFNGWGQENTGAAGWKKDPRKAANGIEDQPIAKDRLIADFIIEESGATKLATWLVMEGGGIEVNGKGTAICTESCILNANRNPGRSKIEVEAELLRLLGVEKIIWLPGVKAQEITDGHVDFYARFVGESTVVFALESDPHSADYAPTHINQQILSTAIDARGNKITAVPLMAPDLSLVRAAVEARNNWNTGQSLFNAANFAAGYAGFYLARSCVLMAQFGDAAADQAAFQTIRELYPERAVIGIPTDGLANAGGTIHCATQQQI